MAGFSFTMTATDHTAQIPLHDLYRFRRGGDGAEVVYCCPEVHLTSSDRDIQSRGSIVGCRYERKQAWLVWDGREWRTAAGPIARKFEKLPILGEVPH
jgi:hypothetical protein